MIKKTKLAMGLAGLLAISTMGCDIFGSDNNNEIESPSSEPEINSSSSENQSSSSFDFNWQSMKSSSSSAFVDPNPYRVTASCSIYPKENCQKEIVTQDPCGWMEGCPTYEKIVCWGDTRASSIATRNGSKMVMPGDTIIAVNSKIINESDTTLFLGNKVKTCDGKTSGASSGIFLPLKDGGYCEMGCIELYKEGEGPIYSF